MSKQVDNIRSGINIELIALLITIIGTFLGAHFLIDSKFERHAERTDKLYEMFYELLKEDKK
jgi:hypothetical protein